MAFVWPKQFQQCAFGDSSCPGLRDIQMQQEWSRLGRLRARSPGQPGGVLEGRRAPCTVSVGSKAPAHRTAFKKGIPASSLPGPQTPSGPLGVTGKGLPWAPPKGADNLQVLQPPYCEAPPCCLSGCRTKPTAAPSKPTRGNPGPPGAVG